MWWHRRAHTQSSEPTQQEAGSREAALSGWALLKGWGDRDTSRDRRRPWGWSMDLVAQLHGKRAVVDEPERKDSGSFQGVRSRGARFCGLNPGSLF